MSKVSRYAYEPLARIVAGRLDLPYCPGKKQCPGCNAKEHAGPAAVARYLGFHESAPLRWIGPGIPEPSAQRACDELGIDPDSVPGWDWYAAVTIDDDDEAWIEAWLRGDFDEPEPAEEPAVEHYEQGSFFELAT